MKVLVTGGAGFIGSHMVDRLAARGDRVWVLDDFSNGCRANLRRHVRGDQVAIVEGSIEDVSLVRSVMTKVDRVYHLAAVVGVRQVMQDPLRALEANVIGTHVVLRHAYELGRPVVLASTSEVYGKTTRLPFREGDDRVLGDTGVHRWSYSTAKALNEHTAHAYADKGLAISVVRYFNSYGPRSGEGGYGGVVAAFIRHALADQPLPIHGDGGQSRCFTFVDDTVEGTLRVGESDSSRGLTFNVGSREETTIETLAREIIALTGSSSSLRYLSHEEVYGKGFEDTARRVPCLDRMEAVLRWTPTRSLREGLRETIAWQIAERRVTPVAT